MFGCTFLRRTTDSQRQEYGADYSKVSFGILHFHFFPFFTYKIFKKLGRVKIHISK